MDTPFVPVGYSEVAPGQVASVVTCLEMLSRPTPGSVGLPPRVTLERMPNPGLESYRTLYRTVGSDWLWYSRLLMSDEELGAILGDARVEVFVLHEAGRDIGLLELDFRQRGECELAFLGLVSGATGRGLGRAVMNFAIRHAWSRAIRRFWVHTCTFDSPAALAFYIRSGFRPYAFRVEVQADPRLTGHLPRGAAPQVPLIDVPLLPG